MKLICTLLFTAAIIAASSCADDVIIDDDSPKDQAGGVDAIVDDENSEKTSSGFTGFLDGIRRPAAGFLGNLGSMFSRKPEPPVIVTKLETIHVTKTLIRNPVCITSYLPKPDCVPQDYRAKSEGDTDVSSGEELESLERTRRYISFDEPTPEIPAVKGGIVESQVGDNAHDTGRYLFDHKQTKYVTHTITATKVLKKFDNKVTATLVVNNCMPYGHKIPKCVGKYKSVEGEEVQPKAEEVKSDSKDMKSKPDEKKQPEKKEEKQP